MKKASTKVKAFFITIFIKEQNKSPQNWGLILWTWFIKTYKFPHTGCYLNYSNYLSKSQIAENKITKIKFYSIVHTTPVGCEVRTDYLYFLTNKITKRRNNPNKRIAPPSRLSVRCWTIIVTSIPPCKILMSTLFKGRIKAPKIEGWYSELDSSKLTSFPIQVGT